MIEITIRNTKDSSRKFAGLNDYIKACRGSKYGANAFIQRSEAIIRAELKKWNLGRLRTPIALIYTFYEPTRRRDKGNIAAFFDKAFEDALVREGHIEDDGWDEIAYFHYYFRIDKEDPRVEIKIIEEAKEDTQ